MEIFKPPTDNLYKFMAIAGLIIAGISFLYPASKVYQLHLEQISLEQDVNLHEQGVNLHEAANEKEKDGIKTNDVQIAKKKQDFGRVRAKTYELRKRLNQLSYATKTIFFFNFIAIAGFAFGCYLARKGFTLWYWKVQVYQDALLKKQAEELIPNIVENAKKQKRRTTY